MFNVEVDASGVAVATWDQPGRSMNVIDAATLDALDALVDRAVSDDAIAGVVLTSGKRAFGAGADLSMIEDLCFGEHDLETLLAKVSVFQRTLRKLERSGVPFVAALNGTALGGCFELALACHHRVATTASHAQFGLPEVQLGLLPGAGGTQRLPRMIGIEAALPLLLEGKKLRADKAHAAGLVDALAEPEALIETAAAWIRNGGAAAKPWDEKRFRVPKGDVQSPKGQQTFMAANAMLRAKTFGNYPAPHAILSCVYHGLQVPLDVGLDRETRAFVSLLRDPVAGNMVRTMFIHLQQANKLSRRPMLVEAKPVTRLGMLGAGMMGAGIAYVSAEAGIDVVLLDRDEEAAARGKAYSAKVLDRAIQRGRKTDADKEAVLDRIHPTARYEDLEGVDFVVEAVFEDRALKAEVTAKAEAAILPEAVFGSNTSTLPITSLATASKRPAAFIGIHFFSPVDRMPLVEVIRGEQTSDDALARTLDYVRQIGKTPIVVNDSRGFFTSRVFSTYVLEGIGMLSEGIAPALIENAGRMTSMPVAPLALADEVAIELLYRIRQQTRADLGDAFQETPGDRIIVEMVEQHGRCGRAKGAGFYVYPSDGPKHLWPALSATFDATRTDADVDELKRRFLYIQALETARCMEERVLLAPQDGDVGAILGWGFAPWTGGPLSYIDTIGVAAFVAEAHRLAAKHGARFTPPALLEQMASEGRTFYARTPN